METTTNRTSFRDDDLLVRMDITEDVRSTIRAERRRRKTLLLGLALLQILIGASLGMLITGHKFGKAAGLVALEAWAIYLTFWMIRMIKRV